MSFMSSLSRLHRFPFALACSVLLGTGLSVSADIVVNTSTELAEAPVGHAIEVRGVARPDDIPYSSYVAAMRAFDQYHHYAPSAPLLFSARTHDGKLDGLRVSITGEQVWIPVPIDARGQFSLPMRQDALDDKAVVLSNVRDGQVNWASVIRTPGLPEGSLRLGDLRLGCRVDYALERQQTSLWVATLLRVVGGCNSDGRMTRALKRPGMHVKLSYQDREEILPDRYYVSHHTAWTMPLTDGDWPDDTLIQFIEPDSNFVLDKACADQLQRESQKPYSHGSSTYSENDCVWHPGDD
ncbi:MAG: hypothetical protein JO218_13580 [Burkholderiales bacterium]|nr:hypothetical protein [Burkholderiales bacterium]